MKLSDTTAAQAETLLRKWERASQDMSFAEFVGGASKLPCEDCIMVRWEGMWLGIEVDGHSHT